MLSPHPPIDVPHRGFSAVGKENIGKVTNFGVDEQYQSKVALKDMKVCQTSWTRTTRLHTRTF